MSFVKALVDLFLHLDVHLSNIITQYGAWTYGLMFIVIFIETGLVVTPFLPGDNIKWIKREYLVRTQTFFDKYGRSTIFLARFVPIVRTFAPFVAGIGQMPYGAFISYNIFGGIAWVALFTFAGYFFGNIPFIRQHFSLVVIAIVLISIVPMVIEAVKAQREGKQAKAEATEIP